MTYKELVDRLKQIAHRHKMIVDFGYGEISDIKVKSQDDVADNREADYPYMFLNPSPHLRDQNSITYNFNLIMMDMAKDDDYNDDVVRIQSECQQYIDDVLAELHFEMQDLDVDLNIQLTPFKERFQDNVAGMTANLAITLPVGLNRCIAPIRPKLIGELQVAASGRRLLDPDEVAALWFENGSSDIGSVVSFGLFQKTYDTGFYELTLTQDFTFVEPVAGEILPIQPKLTGNGGPTIPGPTTQTPWPTEYTPDTFTWTATWYGEASELAAIQHFNLFTNQPSEESALYQEAEGTWTIKYYA
jgi:hypothetical protein